jgi:hypothetical protein
MDAVGAREEKEEQIVTYCGLWGIEQITLAGTMFGTKAPCLRDVWELVGTNVNEVALALQISIEGDMLIAVMEKNANSCWLSPSV